MFFPRSARRIRLARAAFVLVGLAPCVALVGWAVQRHSDAHRDAIRRGWEQAIGMPVTIASVDHPLPGVIRARGCELAAVDGRAVLEVASVVVESTPAEVRLRIGALACDPAGAAALAGLAAEWLERGARFRHDVVIEVADFSWQVPDAAGRAERHAVGSMRIECVAQAGDRAVRVVRRDGDEELDQVRVVRTDDDSRGVCLDVKVSCVAPLPLPILAAVAGHSPVARFPFGRAAVVRGELDAMLADGRWSGTAAGRVGDIDLGTCTAALAGRAAGTMEMIVEGVEWRDGRLAVADFTCVALAGSFDRRLLDSAVAMLGCRVGPASLNAVADRDHRFDAFGCTVRIDGRGIEIAGSPSLGGALAVADGRSLLEPPSGVVRADRIVWLMAEPGAVSVPSSGAGAWLMSVLPPVGGAGDRTSRAGGMPGDGTF